MHDLTYLEVLDVLQISPIPLWPAPDTSFMIHVCCLLVEICCLCHPLHTNDNQDLKLFILLFTDSLFVNWFILQASLVCLLFGETLSMG